MMNVAVPREDQGNAHVKALWLSRDEEKRCHRGRGPWRLIQSVQFLGLYLEPSTAPEGEDRPALFFPSLPPLPEFCSGAERNSRAPLLQILVGRLGPAHRPPSYLGQVLGEGCLLVRNRCEGPWGLWFGFRQGWLRASHWTSMLLHSLSCCTDRSLCRGCPSQLHLGILSLYFQSESCSVMSDSLWPHGQNPMLCPWDSPGKNTRVGCHFLLQGIFLTQGSNPGLPHFRQILYHLGHQGSPKSGSKFTFPIKSLILFSNNNLSFSHSPKGHSSCNTLHLLKLLVDLSPSPTGPENPSDEGPHQIQMHRQPGRSHKWEMQFFYGARMVCILVWARKLGVSGSVMNGGGDLPHLKG